MFIKKTVEVKGLDVKVVVNGMSLSEMYRAMRLDIADIVEVFTAPQVKELTKYCFLGKVDKAFKAFKEYLGLANDIKTELDDNDLDFTNWTITAYGEDAEHGKKVDIVIREGKIETLNINLDDFSVVYGDGEYIVTKGDFEFGIEESDLVETIKMVKEDFSKENLKEVAEAMKVYQNNVTEGIKEGMEVAKRHKSMFRKDAEMEVKTGKVFVRPVDFEDILKKQREQEAENFQQQ